MVVANQEGHLVSDVFGKIMNAFLDHPIVEAEGSNAAPQSPSNRKMVFLAMLLQVKISGSLLLLNCNRTILAKKGTRITTDNCRLGRSIRQGRGARQHQFQRRQLLTPARK